MPGASREHPTPPPSIGQLTLFADADADADAPAPTPAAVARGWGGARKGAGRKRRDPKGRASVAHRKRPVHRAYHPVHITLRAKGGLPSFRHERIQRMLTSILSRQQPEHRPRRKAYAGDFQVVHFSIQSNHLHFIVEAKKGALRSGVSGLVIAFAKRLNELLGRGGGRGRGKVWADRYHAHELESPREVRNALVYVLQNYRKHGNAAFGPVADPHSSAYRFDGWSGPVYTLAFAPEPGEPPWRPVRPSTWLLGVGWKARHPPIRPSERPRDGVLRKA